MKKYLLIFCKGLLRLLVLGFIVFSMVWLFTTPSFPDWVNISMFAIIIIIFTYCLGSLDIKSIGQDNNTDK
jgi:ABC-type multidrug transport system permease subunit